MGTMRNRHGDSVVALDTPDGSIAVELAGSRLNGSSRHAIMNRSARSGRSSRRRRSNTASERSASDSSLPDVTINHHSLQSSNVSRQSSHHDKCSGRRARDNSKPVCSTGSEINSSGSDSSSEVGTARKPIRALVATFQASAEHVLLASFMHMQISVIVEFAVGVAGLKCALQENQKVRPYLPMAVLPTHVIHCSLMELL